MHLGFIIKQLSADEIKNKQIFIPEADRGMFPPPKVLFFLEFEDDIFGVYLDKNGYIVGLEEWFDKRPIVESNYVIISKYSEGFLLSVVSEIVKKQLDFERQLNLIMNQDLDSILCPNCRHILEYAGSKGDFFKLKCPKCGFTLVRKIKGSNKNHI